MEATNVRLISKEKLLDERLESILGEKLFIRYAEETENEILIETVLGKDRAFIYLIADKKDIEKRNAGFKDILIIFQDPIEATIFSWFIPSFSNEVEIYFYRDWTIFYIDSPSNFDVKKALSATRLAVSEK